MSATKIWKIETLEIVVKKVYVWIEADNVAEARRKLKNNDFFDYEENTNQDQAMVRHVVSVELRT